MAYYNLDLRSKILPQKQSTDYNCAKTCLAMCLKISVDKIMADPRYSKDEVESWKNIALDFSGRKFIAENEPASLQSVFNSLLNGYPVCVQIAPGTSSHWVTVYKYEGSDSALAPSNFRCIDPYNNSDVVLSSALKYEGVYCVYHLAPNLER